MANEHRKAYSTLYRLEFDIPHHEAIAAAAQKLLTPTAASEVSKVLAPGKASTLQQVAGWADRIKHRKPTPDDDPDTKDFIEQNPHSGEWHFVDLPYGCTGYDPAKYPTFCAGDNVVNILVECIHVLTKQSTRFSELNALRLLTHLVGDVHQPLHVGCSYFQPSGSSVSLTGDPAVVIAGGCSKDRGGNALILPADAVPDAKPTNLHAYWDGGLGGEVKDTTSSGSDELTFNQEATRQAADKILANLGSRVPRQQGSSGPIAPQVLNTWPPDWASHSLVAARQAYVSITVVGPAESSNSDNKTYHVAWEGRNTYNERCKPLLVEQMSLGAKNLASLVNALYP